MEMMALLEGLLQVPEGSEVLVLSDSQYVIDGMNNVLERQTRSGHFWLPIANQQLFKDLVAAHNLHKEVVWQKVPRTHARIVECDRMATKARVSKLHGIKRHNL